MVGCGVGSKTHLNVLIRIGGVVTRRTSVFPQMQQVQYDCGKCGWIVGPYIQNSETEIKVATCPNCQSKGPFSVNVEKVTWPSPAPCPRDGHGAQDCKETAVASCYIRLRFKQHESSGCFKGWVCMLAYHF